MGKKQSLEKDILKSSIVTMFVATDLCQLQLYHEAQESFIISSLSLLCLEGRVKNSKQKLTTKSLKSNIIKLFHCRRRVSQIFVKKDY